MLAFDRRGQGAPLVLVHGITECRRAWDPLLPALETSHDVVNVDLRGHGESDRHPPFDPLTLAADVHDVVESAGITDPLLVGHSLGGMVVTAYAASFRCRGVLNIDQSIRLSAFKEALEPLAGLLRGSQADFQQAMSMVFDVMRGPLPDAEWARLSALRRPDQEMVMEIWSPVLDTPVESLESMVSALASSISVPYLSIHGSDPGPGYGEWLAELISTSEIEIWDGLGHYPHLVQPERFLRRLESYEVSLG